MADKPQVINPTLAEIAKGLLTALKFVLSTSIKDPKVEALINAHLDALRDIAGVLSDEIAENTDQVLEVLNRVGTTSTLPYAEERLRVVILKKVKDPELQETLIVLSQALIKSIHFFLDDDKDNLEQLADFWKDFLASPNALAVLQIWVVELTKKFIKRPSDQEFIATQIQTIIKYIIARRAEAQEAEA